MRAIHWRCVARGSREAARTLTMALGLKNLRAVSESAVDPKQLGRHDLLLVGMPARREWLPDVDGHVIFKDNAFVLQDTSFDQPWDAFFGVGRHPLSPQRVAGIFLPLSAAYAEAVATIKTLRRHPSQPSTDISAPCFTPWSPRRS